MTLACPLLTQLTNTCVWVNVTSSILLSQAEITACWRRILYLNLVSLSSSESSSQQCTSTLYPLQLLFSLNGKPSHSMPTSYLSVAFNFSWTKRTLQTGNISGNVTSPREKLPELCTRYYMPSEFSHAMVEHDRVSEHVSSLWRGGGGTGLFSRFQPGSVTGKFPSSVEKNKLWPILVPQKRHSSELMTKDNLL